MRARGITPGCSGLPSIVCVFPGKRVKRDFPPHSLALSDPSLFPTWLPYLPLWAHRQAHWHSALLASALGWVVLILHICPAESFSHHRRHQTCREEEKRELDGSILTLASDLKVSLSLFL